VFFAQAADQLQGAILLLDEPGLSLHGLKQREFRKTLSRLAEDNQLLFTTHSPFLVGPDELDVVRVVEMTDRNVGTKIHTEIMANDPASLLPLQEALGYDLAQSLFAQQRNLILEGLTDYWYIEATASLIRADGGADLKENIALVPASSAGKVVYFATILHAQKLKVASLLDSDAAGDQAANQETLVHTLGNKGILRTADSYKGTVAHPEIEDMLRQTLVKVGKEDLGWDVTTVAGEQPGRPIVDIFTDTIDGFSKYKLAKAYLRWTRDHDASDLGGEELAAFTDLIERTNKALK
jgi:predicted ATP-dependent endonuclease of OLD family